MNNIFLDTSGLVALLSKKDKNHESAVSYWNNLIKLNMTVYLTDYIFDETYAILRSRLSYDVAKNFGDLVLESTVLNLINVDEGLFEAAWKIVRKYSDKAYSFTDCTSFAAMELYGIEVAFSFDRNFAQHGFLLQPGL